MDTFRFAWLSNADATEPYAPCPIGIKFVYLEEREKKRGKTLMEKNKRRRISCTGDYESFFISLFSAHLMSTKNMSFPTLTSWYWRRPI